MPSPRRTHINLDFALIMHRMVMRLSERNSITLLSADIEILLNNIDYFERKAVRENQILQAEYEQKLDRVEAENSRYEATIFDLEGKIDDLENKLLKLKKKKDAKTMSLFEARE